MQHSRPRLEAVLLHGDPAHGSVVDDDDDDGFCGSAYPGALLPSLAAPSDELGAPTAAIGHIIDAPHNFGLVPLGLEQHLSRPQQSTASRIALATEVVPSGTIRHPAGGFATSSPAGRRLA